VPAVILHPLNQML